MCLQSYDNGPLAVHFFERRPKNLDQDCTKTNSTPWHDVKFNLPIGTWPNWICTGGKFSVVEPTPDCLVQSIKGQLHTIPAGDSFAEVERMDDTRARSRPVPTLQLPQPTGGRIFVWKGSSCSRHLNVLMIPNAILGFRLLQHLELANLCTAQPFSCAVLSMH